MGENFNQDNTPATYAETNSILKGSLLGTDFYPIASRASFYNNYNHNTALASAQCWTDSSSDSTIFAGLTTHPSNITYHCSTSPSPYLDTVLSQNHTISEAHYHTDEIANSLYALQGECKLSSHECIRKSILYTDRVVESAENSTGLVTIVSASSTSSEVGYPVEEDSGNDGTYSVVEELPSDHDDDSSNEILSDDDDEDDNQLRHHRCRLFRENNFMKMYSDSSDDSGSSRPLRTAKSHRRVYECLKKCLTAEVNIRHSIACANRKYAQNVVGLVRNDVFSGSTSNDEDFNSSCASIDLGKQNVGFSYLQLDHPPGSLPTSLSSARHPMPRYQTDASCKSGLTLALAKQDDYPFGRSYQIVHPSTPDNLADETNLADIILEPPRMFRSCSEKENTATVTSSSNMAGELIEYVVSLPGGSYQDQIIFKSDDSRSSKTCDATLNQTHCSYLVTNSRMEIFENTDDTFTCRVENDPNNCTPCPKPVAISISSESDTASHIESFAQSSCDVYESSLLSKSGKTNCLSNPGEPSFVGSNEISPQPPSLLHALAECGFITNARCESTISQITSPFHSHFKMTTANGIQRQAESSDVAIVGLLPTNLIGLGKNLGILVSSSATNYFSLDTYGSCRYLADQLHVTDAMAAADSNSSFFWKMDATRSASYVYSLCKSRAAHFPSECRKWLVVVVETISCPSNAESVLPDCSYQLRIDKRRLIDVGFSTTLYTLIAHLTSISNYERQKCVILRSKDPAIEEKFVKQLEETADSKKNNLELEHSYRMNDKLVVNTCESTVPGLSYSNDSVAKNLMATLRKAQNVEKASNRWKSILDCHLPDAELAEGWAYSAVVVSDAARSWKAVVKGAIVHNKACGEEGTEELALLASAMFHQLVITVGHAPCALGGWQLLSGKNAYLYGRKWPHQSCWRRSQSQNYPHDQWQSHRRQQRYPSLGLQGIDTNTNTNNLPLNSASHRILIRPSWQTCDILQAIVAARAGLVQILRDNFSAISPVNRSILYNDDEQLEVGNGKTRDSGYSYGIDDVAKLSTNECNYSEQVAVQDGQWVDCQLQSTSACCNCCQNGHCANCSVGIALYVSNLEAIRKISNYFDRCYLETAHNPQTRVSDPKLDVEHETRRCNKSFTTCHSTGVSSLEGGVDNNNNGPGNDEANCNSKRNREDYVISCSAKYVSSDNSSVSGYAEARKCALYEDAVEDEDEGEDDQDQVTSFIFSSSDSALSEDEDSETGEIGIRMKDEKNSASIRTPVVERVNAKIVENKTELLGILKSTLKRSSNRYCPKKYRVRFNEDLNQFHEADYIILIPDEFDIDPDSVKDVERKLCKCGDQQSCYKDYYEVDFEVQKRDDSRVENLRHSSSTNSPSLDFTATLDSPNKFVSLITLEPLGDYKSTRYWSGPAPTSFSYDMSGSTISLNDDTRCEKWRESRNESDILWYEKIRTLQQQQLQHIQRLKQEQQQIYQQHRHRQHEHIDDGFVARKDQQNPGRMVVFDNSSGSMGYEDETRNIDQGGPSQYIMESNSDESGNQITVDNIQISSPATSEYNVGSGILKGGKFWRCSNMSPGVGCKSAIIANTVGLDISNTSSVVGDDCGGTDNDKRSIKFMDDNPGSKDSCSDKTENHAKSEFTLTFKLGNRVMPCNSLKPNSAVRQLFPDPRFVNPLPTTTAYGDCDAECVVSEGACEGKYVITKESLQAFNEVNKRSVFASSGDKEDRSHEDMQFSKSGSNEDITRNHSIKQTTRERNRSRRSLKRLSNHAAANNHPRAKNKTELSLEDRIKLLTCNIDNEPRAPLENTDQGMSSTPEFTRTVVLQHTSLAGRSTCSCCCQEVATSSPTTRSSFHSTFAFTATTVPARTPTISTHSTELEKWSNYERFSNLLDKTSDNKRVQATVKRQLYYPNDQSVCQLIRANVATHTKIHSDESTMGNWEMLKLELAGDRNSILSATSIGTEYSIDDIDQVLAEPVTNEKVLLPVVEANTSSIDPIQDELQVFVQQDASRMERIKKRYSSGTSAAPPAMSNDKEPSECGSSRRPSVRGFNSSSDCSIETSQKVAQLSQFPSTQSTGRLTWPICRSAERANTNDNEAVLHSNQISSFGEGCDTTATATATASASASATSEFATDANRAEFESTWSTRTADRPQQRAAKVDAAAAAAAAFTRYDWQALERRPFDLWTETEAAASSSSSSSDRRNSGSQLDPHYAAGSRRGSNASTSNTKPNISALSNDAANASTHTRTRISAPHACGWSRSATNTADETQLGTSATYPIQTARSSAVSVSHHQPPAVQLPSPAVGSALRAHLLGTRRGHRESPLSQVCRSASASASSQFSLYTEPACTPIATSAAAAFAFAPHRRPWSQQITPAEKGARTSDVSSAATSSYDQQPRTNAQVGAPYSTSGTCPNAATAWQCGTRSDLRVLGQPVEFIPPNYPVARRSSALPISAFDSSPTPLELQNRSVRYPTTERVVDATTYTYDGQNYAKPTRQTAASDPLVARPIIVSQNRVGISFATITSGSSSFHPPQLRVSDPSSIV